MATKELDLLSKDIAKSLKKLSQAGVAESSNSAEYAKFLKKTKAQALTFDKEAPEYIDYVARGVKPKKTEVIGNGKQATTTTTKPKETKEASGEGKKRKEATAKSDETGKATKKAKNA